VSDIIKLLPDHVANQIAAGEVIQRPASVVKELLENAIDAGSTEIKLLVKDGGKSLIQLIDNGKGMSATDARMCWERHATSKINAVEDIFKIRTMGFRGEALASIASVAMVELKTKRADEAVGTFIRIEGSEVKLQEVTATINGTSIQVKNLFYNVPARKNFLKSDAVETRHIIDEFIRVALAHPHIAMSMHHNGNETYILRSGDLALRIQELFKLETTRQILPIDEQTTMVGLSGYIGKPEFAKKTRGEQFFFVNNRYIRDAYLNHALVSCYENLITKEQFPFYVVRIEIDPAMIDVNVHPTKTEIKFEDERSIYQIVKAVCKQALGQHYHIPVYEPLGNESFPSMHPQPATNPQPAYKSNTFTRPANSNDWQQLFSVLQTPETIGDMPSERPFMRQPEKEIPLEPEILKRNLMQIHNSLILAQVKSGILLINQQAAHERILFEKFMQVSPQTPMHSQQRLFPKTITLSSGDEQIVNDLMPEFQRMGFDISSLGKQTFVVNGMPAEMSHRDEEDLMLTFIEQYKQQSYASVDARERMCRILAGQLSITRGTALSHEEMTSLTEELFACEQPQYAPDGTPCIKTIGLNMLFELMGSKA
jgi:DNA mismatch repair protein MutL